MVEPVQPITTQLNVEFWFRLVYECFHGGCTGTSNYATLATFLSKVWLWIVGVGYVVALIALFVIIYSLVRLFELRKKEEEELGKLILAPDEISGGHPRWKHIEELANGNTSTQWREAIIEADIMLDELLAQRGYSGKTVGEKLQQADFQTIRDAWQAHLVRNRIAHDGSAFEVSAGLAHRTIARYELVFREFKAI